MLLHVDNVNFKIKPTGQEIGGIKWSDRGAWMKANPSLGHIKKLDDLQLKVERAKQSPNDLSGVLCKEFNIRETVHSAWLSFDAINNTDTFDLENFRGAYCIGALTCPSRQT